MVVLGSQQAGTLKLGSTKHEKWASIQLLTLCLNFFGYFAEIWSYFSMKINKQKGRKCLRCVKEFSHRFNLANGKYLPIFLMGFTRIVKAAHFAQVIDFRELHVKNWKQKDIAWIFFTKLIHAQLEFVTQFVTWELLPNACQNKCIYKHLINPKYIKQWIIYLLHKKCPYSELFWSVFFPHFPAFGLNKYSIRMRENAGKMWTRITPNTDTFYAVITWKRAYDRELLDITVHESVKQRRRRRASWSKTKSRQNENRQINNMIKNKQICFEVTRAWDCFTTVMCIMHLYWNVFQ